MKLVNRSTWVVKIGSAVLTADGKGLDRPALTSWVDQMADWVEAGKRLILVSSGAVAEGMSRMGMSQRPQTLHELQAVAAIGQMGLIQAWESCFKRRGLHTAQVLVTHDDLSNRKRYLNARSTLKTLLDLGVVPVVNENDAVANEELRFGDNDTLAALVANLVEADKLLLLTDQQGMFDADPRKHPGARLIEEANVDDTRLDEVAAGGSGTLGRGGMLTKLRAARTAARSGTETLIIPGKLPGILASIAAGEKLGTRLKPSQTPDAARKRWLAAQLQAKGKVTIDDGAEQYVTQQGSSLLAVGVKSIEGDFQRGDVVVIVNGTGKEIARGLINYSHADTKQIIGKPSSEIKTILGYVDEAELIHRDNLVLM